jgi:hypothetical protein
METSQVNELPSVFVFQQIVFICYLFLPVLSFNPVVQVLHRKFVFER